MAPDRASPSGIEDMFIITCPVMSAPTLARVSRPSAPPNQWVPYANRCSADHDQCRASAYPDDAAFGDNVDGRCRWQRLRSAAQCRCRRLSGSEQPRSLVWKGFSSALIRSVASSRMATSEAPSQIAPGSTLCSTPASGTHSYGGGPSSHPLPEWHAAFSLFRSGLTSSVALPPAKMAVFGSRAALGNAP